MPSDTNALIWIIIVAVTGVGANIVSIIVAFRRRPPAEAQFADSQKNENEHARLHKRITALTNPETTPFVIKAVNDAEEKHRKQFRDEICTDVKRLTKITTALAVKLGIEVTEEL